MLNQVKTKIPHEKRSTNMYDVYTWIEKVIDSCTTSKQISAAKKLVSAFVELYPHESRLNNTLYQHTHQLWSDMLDKEIAAGLKPFSKKSNT